MKRTVGHDLPLTLSISFFVEGFFFLATAMRRAGRELWIAKRFLILTIAVFLTAVAAPANGVVLLAFIIRRSAFRA